MALVVLAAEPRAAISAHEPQMRVLVEEGSQLLLRADGFVQVLVDALLLDPEHPQRTSKRTDFEAAKGQVQRVRPQFELRPQAGLSIVRSRLRTSLRRSSSSLSTRRAERRCCRTRA